MTNGYHLNLERAVRAVFSTVSDQAGYANTHHRMLFARHYAGDKIGLSSVRDLVVARIVRVLDHGTDQDGGMVY